MIELKQVTKTYPTRDGVNVILDGVDFTFPARTNVGVLGRNGAGKSTLLRLLSGAEQPDSGEVVHSGRISWPIGFKGGVAGSLTGEENCRLVARLYGVDVDQVVADAMDFASLGNYFFEPVKNYSSGMRARLAFGLSMAVEFDVYLVDEVTAVGDATFKEKARKAFAARAERSSVIIVSHSMSTVKAYCKHCALLRNGKLYYFDSIREAQRLYEAA